MSVEVIERPGRGRPPRCSPELAERIISLHHSGLSHARISKLLDAEGVPLPGGGTRWLRSSVDRILHTKYARDLQADLRPEDQTGG
jgi:hypothetical protein